LAWSVAVTVLVAVVVEAVVGVISTHLVFRVVTIGDLQSREGNIHVVGTLLVNVSGIRIDVCGDPTPWFASTSPNKGLWSDDDSKDTITAADLVAHLSS
jgi:xanthine dehydrogenase iron-sulfur cluster and FAD-binding subunit A